MDKRAETLIFSHRFSTVSESRTIPGSHTLIVLQRMKVLVYADNAAGLQLSKNRRIAEICILYYTLLGNAVLYCFILGYATLRYIYWAMPCCVIIIVLVNDILYSIVLSFVVLYFLVMCAMLCYAGLCSVVVCYAVIYWVVLGFFVFLCCAILCCFARLC